MRDTPRRLILQAKETNISGWWPAELAEFMMDGGDLLIFSVFLSPPRTHDGRACTLLIFCATALTRYTDTIQEHSRHLGSAW